MFYDDFDWNWEQQALNYEVGPFNSQSLNRWPLFQTHIGEVLTFLTLSNPIISGLGDFDWINLFGENVSPIDWFNHEQQPEQPLLDSGAEIHIPCSIGAEQGSMTVQHQDVNTRLGRTRGHSGTGVTDTVVSPYQTTSITGEAEGGGQLNATQPAALATTSVPSLANEQRAETTRNIAEGGCQIESSRKSKHGQTEKYFCHYSDCSRSQPGSGFTRRDHLNQHLRGPHKEAWVPRVRASPAVASSSCDPIAAADQNAQAPQQSKKRKLEEDIESDAHRGLMNELINRLTEERSKRLLVEQENQQLQQEIRGLRQQVANYE